MSGDSTKAMESEERIWNYEQAQYRIVDLLQSCLRPRSIKISDYLSTSFDM